MEFIATYWNDNALGKCITHVHVFAVSFIILIGKLFKSFYSLCYSIMLNRVLPFTPTRIKCREGHSFEQLNIIQNITSNYTSLFIKYTCTNI